MSDCAPMLLGSHTFSDADQQTFAAESNDRNPMHVDPLAARRLLSGRQVVHGMHTLLHGLHLWRGERPPGDLRIRCEFAQPVSVGDDVVFHQRAGEAGRTVITASVDGTVCTEITLEPMTAQPATAAPATTPLPLRQISTLLTALDEEPGSQVGTWLALESTAVTPAPRFPQAEARLGAASMQALAQLSYFVGMVCPGLHSVFSSLNLVVPAQQDGVPPLRFEVRRYDPRFRLFIVQYDGPVRGELRAFLRPPPQPQPSTREVAALVTPALFARTRSLVIGGSRGLGEVTAKLLAAGGGQVQISYAAGAADAQAVADDINSVAPGHCSTLALDLNAPPGDAWPVDPAGLDAVFYFATPRIYTRRSEAFERRAFLGFVEFYLDRFYQLCRWLNQTERTRPVKVYLPSTVFITDRPKGMTEYAMAKAAAEVLADDLNRALDNVRVVHTRLPRLATDQTASILKVEVGSNVDVLLPVLRQVLDR